MRPKKLVISGWGPYKTKTEIDFQKFDGRGLFLVTGATGAGKTTIFDAITYALYGSLSGEMREKNSVRSDFADAETPTYVEFFMYHGGKEYRIVRNPEYVRPRKRGKDGALTKEKENAVLYLPDERIIEGTKEVNAKVQEILVLDYQQFKQITMIAQGEFARLLTAPPKDKTRIFRDIFGTGIYEQFAQALRSKSNELYGKVMEQRHKLEEDVRLLLVNREQQEAIEKLLELTEMVNWNYEAVRKELDLLCERAAEQESSLQEECKQIQEQNSLLTKEVTEKRLENEQIERLEQAKSTLQQLYEMAESIEEKKRLYECARKAEQLLPYKIKMQTVRETLLRAKRSLESLRESEADMQGQLEKLLPFVEKKESWQQYLDTYKSFEETREKRADLEKTVRRTGAERETATKDYLSAEKLCEQKRAAYAEADKIYRHAVIGIAARMLKDGTPCPVCGSLNHPNPAKEDAGLPSEAELNALKEEVNAAEEKLSILQEKAVSLKTLAEEQERNLQDLCARIFDLEKALKENKQQILEETAFTEADFWELSYQEKLTYVQRQINQATSIQATLAAVAEQKKATETEIESRDKEYAESKTAYQDAVHKAGFADVAQAEASVLEEKVTVSLEKQIADYTNQLTAAQGIKEHLEETITNKEKHNLQSLHEKIDMINGVLAEKQKQLKQAHAFHEEAKKTTTQFAEKSIRIEKAKEEYGYVKDLDNLASGNNTKRLVFEQYVLAGYFEEILRAANLRFLKMTGGRYEMSRVQEAGDGRVKDSLEIQVMDFYTGKSRSVKTLSGGESFKASLSLALGMSDVIQAMNGGIKVDTLFIDEGFGALDSESLDQACETLMGLVEHNRLIGIISHVPELRERIDCQLVVEKTNSGSSVKIRV